jgi:malate synthase
MPEANQIHSSKQRDIQVKANHLLAVPKGTITEAGVRMNINVGIQYVASWLCGRGAVPLHNLMEDAATAEISRAQLWQWIRHPKGVLDDGRKVTAEMYENLKIEELDKIKNEIGEEAYQQGRFSKAVQLFDELILQDDFVDFLTLPGYQNL